MLMYEELKMECPVKGCAEKINMKRTFKNTYHGKCINHQKVVFVMMEYMVL